MKRKIFSTLFIGFISVAGRLHAQPVYSFAKQLRATFSGADARVEALDVDPSGNICVTGLMDGTVDFDPGAGSYNLSGAGIQDAYVAKYDNTGSFLWAYRWGVNSTVTNGRGVAFDQSGNVFVTGIFSGNVDFDPGPGVAMMNAANGYNTFICKYSSAGVFLWAKGILNGAADIVCFKVDAAGNFYIAGNLGATSDFDLGPSTFNVSPTPGGYYDIFMAKYDNNGNLLFAENIGGAYHELIHELNFDAAGNIYISGTYNQSGPSNQAADFDPGPGVSNLTATNPDAEMFFAKYDSNGNYLMAKALNGTGTYEYVSGIATDPSGNIYVSGLFRGTTDFDPGPGVFNQTPVNTDGLFYGKYDASGNFIWAKMLNPSNTGGNNGMKDLCYDNNGNLIFGGDFGLGTIDADPGPGVFTLTNLGAPGPTRDFYICVYSSVNGNFVNAFSVGSNQSSTENNCMQLGVFNSALYVVGQFGGTEDFDPGPNTNNLVSGSINVDGYFAKYDNPCIAAPPQPGAISGPIAICPGTTNTYSITAVTGATSYTWTLPNGWTGTSNTTSINATGGVAGGNITVTADNACGSGVAQVLTVTVTNISANASATNPVFCAGGCTTLNMNATGGTPPYTYLWQPGNVANAFTNVCPTNTTTYTCMVTDANSCTQSGSVTVTVNQNPTVTLTAFTNDTVCINAGIFTLTGGSPAGGSYMGPGVTNNQFDAASVGLGIHALDYTYTDPNTGCSSTANATIEVVALPTVLLANQSAVCVDVPVFALTGGIPSGGTYSGPGISNNQLNAAVAGAGTHPITYTYTDPATGCSDSVSKTIVIYPLPPVPTISVNGSTFTSSAATGNQWYRNGNAVNGATGQTFTCTANGNYTVCVTDANGCKSCSAVLNFTTFSIRENQGENELSVYPNPFNTLFTVIAGEAWQSSLTVYNTLGEIIYTTQLANQPLTINLGEVPGGVYIVSVKTAAGVSIRKLVKN